MQAGSVTESSKGERRELRRKAVAWLALCGGLAVGVSLLEARFGAVAVYMTMAAPALALLQGLAFLSAPSSANPAFADGIRRQSRILLPAVFLAPLIMVATEAISGFSGMFLRFGSVLLLVGLILRAYGQAYADTVRALRRQRALLEEDARSPMEREMAEQAAREVDRVRPGAHRHGRGDRPEGGLG